MSRKPQDPSSHVQPRLVAGLLAILLVLGAAQTSAASGDPSVSIESPSEGATVNGTVNVTGSASAPNATVDRVEVRIDGGTWRDATGAEDWFHHWESTNVEDGDHLIEARAWSQNNSSTPDAVNVTVDNEPEPDEPPTVSIEAPGEGATVSGSVDVSGTASDPDGNVTNVELRVDGGPWRNASGAESWSYPWDSTGVSDGDHTIEARAWGENTTSSLDAVNVTVDNAANQEDTGEQNTVPSVVIDRPSEGATVDGDVRIEGRAWDPDGQVQFVRLRVADGEWRSLGAGSVWGFTWDSTSVENGSYTIKARVQDDDGAFGASWTQITVNHSTDETPRTEGSNEPPRLTVETPAPNESVAGDVLFSGTASDPDGELDSLEFRIDAQGWVEQNATETWVKSWNTSRLPEGDHLLTVKVTDAEGATDIVIRSFQVAGSGDPLQAASATNDSANASSPRNLDPPELELTEPAGGTTTDGDLTIEGVATDPDDPPDLLVRYRIDGGDWQEFEVTPGQTFERSVSTDDLSPGEHGIEVHATDGTHASEQRTATFTVQGSQGPPAVLSALVLALLAGGGLIAWARHTEAPP